jgi:D-arabinose 1-dehydrogenase-like Zn-dependent alcohol dehydrogenase
MREVLKSIELKGKSFAFPLTPLANQPTGTAMGSQRELVEATKFIAEHKIVPVVSEIIDGLENYEEGFDAIKQGSQFGKIVVRLRKDHKGKL